VSGQVEMGQAPPQLMPACVVRVFTGGAVPAGADAVIRREDTVENPDSISLRIAPAQVALNQNIRKRAENLVAGTPVMAAGREITPADAGALASFGVLKPCVHRRVRIGIITTGSEVVAGAAAGGALTPWQIRDSNGPTLRSRVAAWPWADACAIDAVSEDPSALREAIARQLDRCDALFLTGGVSMGDQDCVPDVLRSMGAEVLFHRLPIRPGKPILGAVMPTGQAVLALPGNPVSVLVMSAVFGRPVLGHLAGLTDPFVVGRRVTLDRYDGKPIPLWWYRPARLTGPDTASVVASMGSGDIASAARADGFVEVPPNTRELRDAVYWSWT